MLNALKRFYWPATLLLVINVASADELLYIHSPDCGACQKWNRDVGAIYPKTTEANLLPLVKVTLEDWQVGHHPFGECDIRPVFGTPTFIQLSQCKEVDRITGYSNDELFWLALNRMTNRVRAAE